ncbi:aldo/keto reductase [Salinimicrobium terrae]|uniref:aldo/keto reductase n=1 Tax=Salinimicrobium terrae TaxID=470866 RepID=UPI00042666A4|nr:aldo/keto reductase [Salinimicrobium terrae]
MKYRTLGKTGFEISEISLGTWQVGGKWGSGFDDKKAEEILNTAIDNGINFIDTADVYEDGLSEAAVGRVVRSRSEKIYVATKCGRKISPHVNEGYTPEVLTKFVEDSLKNSGLEKIDLIQLHCPPTDVYYRPEIFETFDRLREQGKIDRLGVSVEKVEEGIKALEYENVSTVQIIYNLFRQRPQEKFFKMASEKNVGVIVRVPLASGLLTGKFSKDSHFSPEDHRNFNRNGEAFDKGETFAGVNFKKGVEAANSLKAIFPEKENLAPMALKWILRRQEVSTVIPGASKVEHLLSNLSVEDTPDLTEDQIEKMNLVYEDYIKEEVHQRW